MELLHYDTGPLDTRGPLQIRGSILMIDEDAGQSDDWYLQAQIDELIVEQGKSLSGASPGA
jgi:hypothetical protein